MPRQPSRYAVHLLLEGGHRQTVHFADIASFQSWYAANLNQPDAQAFVNVPLRGLEGEYLVLRPRAVLAVHVEPEFRSLDDG
ncbi:MAG: hypothetical protein ACKO2F_11730 [Cyanobacteriota bacterium]